MDTMIKHEREAHLDCQPNANTVWTHSEKLISMETMVNSEREAKFYGYYD